VGHGTFLSGDTAPRSGQHPCIMDKLATKINVRLDHMENTIGQVRDGALGVGVV